jgi:hypothetical protein
MKDGFYYQRISGIYATRPAEKGKEVRRQADEPILF